MLWERLSWEKLVQLLHRNWKGVSCECSGSWYSGMLCVPSAHLPWVLALFASQLDAHLLWIQQGSPFAVNLVLAVQNQDLVWLKLCSSIPKAMDCFHFLLGDNLLDYQSALRYPFSSAASGNCSTLQTGNLSFVNYLPWVKLDQSGETLCYAYNTFHMLNASMVRSWVIQMTFYLALDLQPQLVHAKLRILGITQRHPFGCFSSPQYVQANLSWFHSCSISNGNKSASWQPA